MSTIGRRVGALAGMTVALAATGVQALKKNQIPGALDAAINVGVGILGGKLIGYVYDVIAGNSTEYPTEDPQDINRVVQVAWDIPVPGDVAYMMQNAASEPSEESTEKEG